MKPFKLFLLALTSSLLLTACANPERTGPRHSIGSASAPIVIQEFSDLQCPACASISPQVEKIVRDNPNIARFEYFHFPLTQHENAFKAAEASECAGDQDKFFEYIEIAFKNQRNLSEDALKSFAAKLSLDTDQFDECFDSGRKKEVVKADLLEGRKRGVNSTPSFYVDGTLVRWGGAEQFEAYLKTLAL